MKLMQWHDRMSDAEAKDVAYWERNMLALKYAEGWYNDDKEEMFDYPYPIDDPNAKYTMQRPHMIPRYPGWRRVLILEGGKITFHIPDDFDVGNLPEIDRNWDGHTTAEKWKRIAETHRIVLEEGD